MDGTQNRTRTCDNPEPGLVGNECDGLATEHGNCTLVVNGGWSEWSSFSSCSTECGGGTRTKTRTCTNPAPSNGGDDCPGSATESSSCNTQSCPASAIIDLPCGGCSIDSNSGWGVWEECPSGTYANAIQVRMDNTMEWYHDKEGMTGVRLRCNDGTSGIDSHYTSSGSWRTWHTTSTAIVGGQLKYDNELNGLRVGATGIRVPTCIGHHSLGNWFTNYGSWRDQELCPPNTVVVGIRTRYDNFGVDHAGIVGVSFWCRYVPNADLTSTCYSTLRYK